jgi:hypothetical protein
MPMIEAPARFAVAIDPARVQRLRERLRETAWAPDLDNDDWRYGTNGSYLRELVDYWIDGYDWFAHEREINGLDHYKVSVDGVPLHFVQRAGVGPAPMPLLLEHGCPWTFWDFQPVIGPLTDPAAHGGDPADAFDVRIPSLPETRTAVNPGEWTLDELDEVFEPYFGPELCVAQTPPSLT